MINNKIKKVLLIIFSIFTLVSIFIGFTSGAFKDGRSQDFQWSPSKMLMEHQNPYQQYTAFKDGKIEKPYMMSQAPNYPASGYVFLWPYSAMDWDMARLSWSISNLIFTLLILIGLQRLFPIKQKELIIFTVLLFIGGASWRTVLGNGQHALFVMAFFIWAIIYSKKNPILSGVFLAVSWFKYTLTFPLTLYFIYKKLYKEVAIAIGIHIFLTIFIAFWIDQSIIDFFFGSIQVAMTATNIGDTDIFGIVKRFHLPSSIAYFLLIIVLYFVTNIFITRKDVTNGLLILSFLSVFSLIVFFHLGYDFVLLLFPLWLIFYTDSISLKTKYLVFSLIGLQWYASSIFPIIRNRFGDIDISTVTNTFIVLKIILIYFLFIDLYGQLIKKKKIGRASCRERV